MIKSKEIYILTHNIYIGNITLYMHMHLQIFYACYAHVSLEREMVTHSSVLALRIPGTEEPGGLLSVGSQRVGHD